MFFSTFKDSLPSILVAFQVDDITPAVHHPVITIQVQLLFAPYAGFPARLPVAKKGFHHPSHFEPVQDSGWQAQHYMHRLQLSAEIRI